MSDVVLHAANMARRFSEISEIESEDYEMSNEAEAKAEAGGLLRQIAEPRPVGDTVQQAIIRAARRMRWSITRTRSLWYAEARRIDATEMDQLRASAREQAARFASLAAALQAVDPDMYQSDITALLETARKLGGAG